MGRAERFQASNFGLDVVGFQVEVHSLLGDLLIVGAPEQHSNLGVREVEVMSEAQPGMGSDTAVQPMT
jgi:hypothetical protein